MDYASTVSTVKYRQYRPSVPPVPRRLGAGVGEPYPKAARGASCRRLCRRSCTLRQYRTSRSKRVGRYAASVPDVA
eukprot:1932450-Rhodomonas_salina.4